MMISGISAANGVQAAFARFDRAAAAVVDNANSDASPDPADSAELSTAIVAMMIEQLVVRATLEAARASNEMIDTIVSRV